MTMDNDPPLILVPFNMLPAENSNPPNPKAVQEQKEFIRDRIVYASNEDLVADAKAWEFFQELGGDVMINAFACNFRVNGTVNTNIVSRFRSFLNNKVLKV